MTASNGYALDLTSPAVHVATSMKGAAPAALSIEELAEGYRHPNPSDLDRVQQHEGVGTKGAAVLWVIGRAVEEIRQRGKSGRGAVQVVEEDGRFRLADGVEDIWFQGKKLTLREHVESPFVGETFDAMSGVFSDNIRRQTGKDSMDDLRESMQAFGWLPYHSAVKDERGVVLVGHRRLAVAEELGIEVREGYEIITHRYGLGDAGDIERFKMAIGSNKGAKPFTDGDWRAIGASMRADGWTFQAIADALGKAEATVRQSLQRLTATVGVTGAVNPDRRRVRTDEKDAIAKRMTSQGATRAQITEVTGYSSGTIDTVRAEMKGIERVRATKTKTADPAVIEEEQTTADPAAVLTHACPSCGFEHPVMDESGDEE